MKPTPIWKRALKDPKKREKLFRYYWYGMVAIQLLIVLGFVMFVVLLWKKYN